MFPLTFLYFITTYSPPHHYRCKEGKRMRKLVDQFFLYLLTYWTSSHCLLFTFFPVWRRIVCLLTFLLPFFLFSLHLSEVLYYRLVVASFYLLTGYLHLVFSFLMNTSICNLPLLLYFCHCHCFCYTKHHISHIARHTSSKFSPGYFLLSSYPSAPCFSSSPFFLNIITFELQSLWWNTKSIIFLLVVFCFLSLSLSLFYLPPHLQTNLSLICLFQWNDEWRMK